MEGLLQHRQEASFICYSGFSWGSDAKRIVALICELGLDAMEESARAPYCHADSLLARMVI